MVWRVHWIEQIITVVCRGTQKNNMKGLSGERIEVGGKGKRHITYVYKLLCTDRHHIHKLPHCVYARRYTCECIRRINTWPKVYHFTLVSYIQVSELAYNVWCIKNWTKQKRHQDRKTNSSVRFLGEVMARQFCFEIYWPLMTASAFASKC